MKRCNNCKQLKDESEFYIRRASKDGLTYKCRSCLHKYAIQYYTKHRKEIVNKAKKYYKNNREKRLIYGKNRRKKNPEDIKEYLKEWRGNNPKYMKEWWQKNPEKMNGYHTRRKRDLYWVELYPNPFDGSEAIEWHHINNKHVVALPKDLHRFYGGYNTESHRANLSYIVDQIYGG